jgi:hypothetical protein
MPRRSMEEIANIVAQRRRADAPLVASMKTIRDRYNRDLVLPMPEIPGQKPQDSSFPNLLLTGIEQTALRAASVLPALSAPPLRPQIAASRERADRRRRAVAGMWTRSYLEERLLGRAFRHLVGYGTFAAVAVPDFKSGHAVFELRDPLGAYPAPRTGFDDDNPADVAFVYGKPWSWVAKTYPDAAATYRSRFGPRPRNISDDDATLYDVVEWVDDTECVIGLLGARTIGDVNGYWREGVWGGPAMELRRWSNPTPGLCPAVVPRRITLDRLAGQMAGVVGQADVADRLMLLDTIAAEKAVFADIVIEGDNPELLTGDWQDGRTGRANIVRNGQVKYLQTSPGPLTHPVIDRIERAIRSDAGIPAQYTGEIPTGIRTGRAAAGVLGEAVDARIQEAQRIMARALRSLNAAGMAIERMWWPKEPKAFVLVNWPGEPEPADYVPSADFETPHTEVSYAYAGADINALGVAVGQLLGANIISDETARAMHPAVADPFVEGERVDVMRLRNALMEALLQGIAQGQTPGVDVAEMIRQRLGGKTIEDAYTDTQKAAQERQATPAPEGAPETQPGMEQPGAGAEQPPEAAVPPPPTGTLDFASLSRALRAAAPRPAA